MKEYHRGEIYWIDAKGAEGHEIYGDRPCVIVSSEIINKHTGCVIVVPTTSNDKKQYPTQARTNSTGKPATALCEQIRVADKSRLREYVGQVSEVEMKNIETALIIALSLDNASKTSKVLEQWAKAYEQALKEKEQEKQEVEKNTVSIEDFIRLEAERDVYKKLYFDLLESTRR